MVKFIEWLIEKVTTLLAWLSEKHVKYARRRVRYLDKEIKKMTYERDKNYKRATHKIEKAMNEKAILEDFLENGEKVLL